MHSHVILKDSICCLFHPKVFQEQVEKRRYDEYKRDREVSEVMVFVVERLG